MQGRGELKNTQVFPCRCTQPQPCSPPLYGTLPMPLAKATLAYTEAGHLLVVQRLTLSNPSSLIDGVWSTWRKISVFLPECTHLCNLWYWDYQCSRAIRGEYSEARCSGVGWSCISGPQREQMQEVWDPISLSKFSGTKRMWHGLMRGNWARNNINGKYQIYFLLIYQSSDNKTRHLVGFWGLCLFSNFAQFAELEKILK